MMDDAKPQIMPDDDTPQYTLRVSMRAKRMQLKVTAWGQVEVVVPCHAAISQVVPFVRKHRRWLVRTLAKLRAMRDGQSAQAATLPESMRLAALGEEWQVIYGRGPRSRLAAAVEQDGRRVLRLAAADDAAARAVLRRWLQDYASRRLIPWLRTVSEECGLPFVHATVRAQKTRWGSCSARRHISLNRHLLFLPPPLVRYLFVHELCHTVHLNHSRHYWALVIRHERSCAARRVSFLCGPAGNNRRRPGALVSPCDHPAVQENIGVKAISGSA
jgi:predicted metal-dependent hydrolase